MTFAKLILDNGAEQQQRRQWIPLSNARHFSVSVCSAQDPPDAGIYVCRRMVASVWMGFVSFHLSGFRFVRLALSFAKINGILSIRSVAPATGCQTNTDFARRPRLITYRCIMDNRIKKKWMGDSEIEEFEEVNANISGSVMIYCETERVNWMKKWSTYNSCSVLVEWVYICICKKPLFTEVKIFKNIY